MLDIVFQALCATLDQLSAGFTASYADGRILHTNRAAQDMMEAGWPIRQQDGYLQGEDRKRTEALLRGLRQVAKEAALSDSRDISLDISLACTASAKGAAIATLKPLRVSAAEPGRRECVIALFIMQPGNRDCRALAGIAECFDLTPAETRTLEQFVQGGTVADVARALDLSENTVKTHLQNIFTKTSSSRQPELLRRVNELQPPLRTANASVPRMGSHPKRRQREGRLRNPGFSSGLRLDNLHSAGS
ncbi:MAG: hypothetical protein HY765_09630 [Rhodomicrobium sp.]|nr:hypothetical protein [Rhodomicrobium sp.]